MKKSYIKKSLLLLGLAAAIVTGGCGKEKETTEEPATERQRETTEKVTTEEATEDTTERTTEEPTTEEPENKQNLDVIKLNAFSENYDGEDTISGHIKDIAYTDGLLIILSDDGHLYSYYTDSGFGYKIYDWGKPGWDMTSIDKVNVTTSQYDGVTGEFFVIEGNRYYYVELEQGKIVYNIEGVLLEGQEIMDFTCWVLDLRFTARTAAGMTLCPTRNILLSLRTAGILIPHSSGAIIQPMNLRLFSLRGSVCQTEPVTTICFPTESFIGAAP